MRMRHCVETRAVSYHLFLTMSQQFLCKWRRNTICFVSTCYDYFEREQISGVAISKQSVYLFEHRFGHKILCSIGDTSYVVSEEVGLQNSLTNGGNNVSLVLKTSKIAARKYRNKDEDFNVSIQPS
jgi:hypothetical protein